MSDYENYFNHKFYRCSVCNIIIKREDLLQDNPCTFMCPNCFAEDLIFPFYGNPDYGYHKYNNTDKDNN